MLNERMARNWFDSKVRLFYVLHFRVWHFVFWYLWFLFRILCISWLTLLFVSFFYFDILLKLLVKISVNWQKLIKTANIQDSIITCIFPIFERPSFVLYCFYQGSTDHGPLQLCPRTEWFMSVDPWLLSALGRSLHTFGSLLWLIGPIIPGPTIPNQNFHRVKQARAIKYFANPFLIKIHFRFWFMAIIIFNLNKIILFFDNLNDVIMM